MKPVLVWLRRDLRIADQPALLAAAGSGRPVVPVFVVDPLLWDAAGSPRRDRLAASLRSLSADLQARYAVQLVLRRGSPLRVIPALAAKLGADAVHVTAETTPYGRRRDAAVAARLADAGVAWVATGTAYAVGPGTVLTGTGTPYRVFTPFSRAWRAHGAPGPAPAPATLVGLRDVPSVGLPRQLPSQLPSPGTAGAVGDGQVGDGQVGDGQVGEAAAHARWREFREGALTAYRTDRDRPDLDGTSRLSAALKYGEIHPRTLLADLGRDQAPGAGASTFVTELAWREFYADVLWHHPRSAWHDLRPLPGMDYDEPGVAFDAWRAGRTGYPFVDAGMRQLAVTGWMHNRVRMVTASFLVKHLHVWWPHGARHFMAQLCDGDLASNSHGWQWVAGTGTDAAPYFRIFNPVAQGQRFDPRGDYVRRWVPELGHLTGAAAHEPWAHTTGYAGGYPTRIVEHAAARAEALRRYAVSRTAAARGGEPTGGPPEDREIAKSAALGPE